LQQEARNRLLEHLSFLDKNGLTSDPLLLMGPGGAFS